MKNQESLSRAIKARALELGFTDCGIARVRSMNDERAYLDLYIDEGRNAGMTYLAERRDLRTQPGLLLPGARSVIVALLNYFPAEEVPSSDVKISTYAYGRDYHEIIREKLNQLCLFLDESFPGHQHKASVDSAPVFEKAWAREAGLGWIGKNCLLVNEHGSYHFIGSILTQAELEPDAPAAEQCGECMLCLEACPTGALTAACRLDARLCISYLTISHKGNYQEGTPGDFKDYIFGCDLCQQACPLNHRARASTEKDFLPGHDILTLQSDDWLKMDEETFRRITASSAMKKTGLENMQRNVRHCRTKQDLTEKS